MGINKFSRIPQRFRSHHAGPDVWQRLTRLVVVLACAGLGVLVFSFFAPEWEKLQELDRTNARLEGRRDALLARRLEVLEEEARGRTDRAWVELVARDRLNLQRPGETIIRIDRGDDAE